TPFAGCANWIVPLTSVIFARSRTICTFSTVASFLTSMAGADRVFQTPPASDCADTPAALLAASRAKIRIFLMEAPRGFAGKRRGSAPEMQVHSSQCYG